MSRRQYGDEMVARCVAELRDLGVPIRETKSSGSVSGDGDAKMKRGGIMLDGKASTIKAHTTAVKQDWDKLQRQAKTHGAIPILVTENAKRERWAFTTPAYAKRAGLTHDAEYEIQNRESSWKAPEEQVAKRLFNKSGATMMAYPWDLFCEQLAKIWGVVDAEEEKGSHQRKRFKGAKRKFSTKKRKFRS